MGRTIGLETSKRKTDMSKTDVRTRRVPLNWEVFVTPGIPSVTTDLPPGAKQRFWPPMSSTLISGKHDAVLVDAFITVAQARALADWVAASGKNLTTICVVRRPPRRRWASPSLAA